MYEFLCYTKNEIWTALNGWSENPFRILMQLLNKFAFISLKLC